VVALWAWQALLDALGWILARIYDFIPNYGLSIIVLTIVTRLVLLPLGIKQIKSMQHMQALQPKLKELQKKYKTNKQKLQEEQMRLYREAGVNPLGGCLPLLLQFPLLFAMYSVIRPVPIVPAPASQPGAAQVFMIEKNHLPVDSDLFRQVITHEGTDFLWMNLQCQLLVAGTQVHQQYTDPADGQLKPVPAGAPIVGEDSSPLPGDPTTVESIDCGSSRFPDVIPYALLVVAMVVTTFYTQLQMQRASPPGAQSQQQQTIMRIMPLMFAVFGLQVVSGLVVYWTVSNLFQLGQQTFLLRAGHIGPEAIERRIAEQRHRAATAEPPKEGLMQRLQRRASDAQKTRGEKDQTQGQPQRPTPGQPQRRSRGKPRSSRQQPRGSNDQGKGTGSSSSKRGKPSGDGASQKPSPGQTSGKTGGQTGGPTGSQTGGPTSKKARGKPGRPSVAKPGNQLGKPDGNPEAPPPEPEDEA
jgi:YidC/Oxa1 family membrane protein insertase